MAQVVRCVGQMIVGHWPVQGWREISPKIITENMIDLLYTISDITLIRNN
jgi:hypothetical protein